ncbi:MAG: HlyD family efflux transporter periplasmic adaptor subunit [Planctomycetes bacterium]|nr:HlyD family efflux transporter periplasmic adaptor subunit [Planctomycetota bacterium]
MNVSSDAAEAPEAVAKTEPEAPVSTSDPDAGSALIPKSSASSTEEADQAYLARCEAWIGSLTTSAAPMTSRIRAKIVSAPKRWWLMPTAFVVVALAGIAVGRWTKPDARAAAATPPTAADPKRTPGPLLAIGTVTAGESVEILARASGTLIALPRAVGDQVAAGEIIAHIDPADEERAVADIDDRLRQSRARSEQLRKDLAAAEAGARDEQLSAERSLALEATRSHEATGRLVRYESLHDQQKVSAAALDVVRTHAQKATSAHARARAAVDSLPAQQAARLEDLRAQIRDSEAQTANQKQTLTDCRERLSATTVTAPIPGTIGAYHVAVGQHLEAFAPGARLMRLEATERAHIAVTLDATAATRVAVDSPVDIRLDSDPGRMIRGRVAAVSPSGVARVDLPQPGPKPLRPGTTAQVAFLAK